MRFHPRLLTTVAIALVATACGSAGTQNSPPTHAATTPSATPVVTATALQSSASSTMAPTAAATPDFSGYEVRQNSRTIIPRDPNASPTYTLDVSCSPGKKVLGGGGSFLAVAGMLTQRNLLASEPVGSTGWRAIGDTQGAADPKGSFKFQLSVWAICATVA